MKKYLLTIALLIASPAYAVANNVPAEQSYCQAYTNMASDLYDVRVEGATKKQMIGLINEQAEQLKAENKLSESKKQASFTVVNALYVNKVTGTKKDKQLFLYTVYALCIEGKI